MSFSAAQRALSILEIVEQVLDTALELSAMNRYPFLRSSSAVCRLWRKPAQRRLLALLFTLRRPAAPNSRPYSARIQLFDNTSASSIAADATDPIALRLG